MLFFLIRLFAQLILVVLRLLPITLFTLLWLISFLTRFLLGITQPWREARARRWEQQAELFTTPERERYKRRIVRN